MTNLTDNFKKRYNISKIKNDLKETVGNDEQLVSDMDDDDYDATGGPMSNTDLTNPLASLLKGK